MGDKHTKEGSAFDTRKLPLLHGKTTLADALEEEENMLIRLSYPSLRFDFYAWVYKRRDDFKVIISHHLSLDDGETCRLAEPKEWRHGSFNLCIPVYTDNWRKHPGKRVLLRIPLPYKVGESMYPGNADEKLRTEAATFIWMQENRPSIPIPFLWGFGFPGGQSFVRFENASLPARICWYLRRIVSSFSGHAVPHRYLAESRKRVLEHGYLIMDFIEETDGTMLSDSWDERREDQGLRTNLFRSLSRILLSLSQSPLPRIGSWTIDHTGKLSLTNRPLLCQIHMAENEGVPTGIPRKLVYVTTDTFYSDLLACHDSRIRNQPNSILDERDGLDQMANLFVMRGLLPHFTTRDRRHGPFVFTLTDLHGSNIFVDRYWHIKCIIDLEWACSLPVEMIFPPYWLTGRGVDQLEDGEFEKFDQMCREFIKIFEEEEKSFPPAYGSATYRTDIMRRGWEVGSFWYFHALLSMKGCYNLFQQHIQPLFCSQFQRDAFTDAVSPFWASDAQKVVTGKLRDKARYEQELRALFEKEPGEE